MFYENDTITKIEDNRKLKLAVKFFFLVENFVFNKYYENVAHYYNLSRIKSKMIIIKETKWCMRH